MFTSPGLASCRRRPLSSNVRPQGTAGPGAPRASGSAAGQVASSGRQTEVNSFFALGRKLSALWSSLGQWFASFTRRHWVGSNQFAPASLFTVSWLGSRMAAALAPATALVVTWAFLAAVGG